MWDANKERIEKAQIQVLNPRIHQKYSGIYWGAEPRYKLVCTERNHTYRFRKHLYTPAAQAQGRPAVVAPRRWDAATLDLNIITRMSMSVDWQCNEFILPKLSITPWDGKYNFECTLPHTPRRWWGIDSRAIRTPLFVNRTFTEWMAWSVLVLLD